MEVAGYQIRDSTPIKAPRFWRTCQVRSCGTNAENMVIEEERNFERKIMNCTLVLLHTQDQIKGIGRCGSPHEGSGSAQETRDA
jgi:hypothetical protein